MSFGLRRLNAQINFMQQDSKTNPGIDKGDGSMGTAWDNYATPGKIFFDANGQTAI